MLANRNRSICVTAEAQRFGIQGDNPPITFRHADKLSMQLNEIPLLVKVLTTGL